MNRSLPPLPEVLVLAAGFSRRLGKPKALARVHGISLIRRTVRLLAAFSVRQIIVVIPPRSARYRAELRGLNVTFAENLQRADGLSSSVRLGISRGRYSSALLVVPVDLMNLRRRDIARLISRWRASRRRVVAKGFADHAGTPLIVPRWLYGPALRIAGDLGLRELVRRLPADQLVRVSLPSAARDIDTPLDLRNARRRFVLSDPSF
jgi:molybdenum cofactor cytidylyltransferase